MNPEDKALLGLFRSLAPEQRRILLEFARFLASRGEALPAQVPPPNPIPRPQQETVVRAIKRLRATYPMLDSAKLLHETSHHMSQHMVQGRPAPEVIEELELVFKRHYLKLKGEE